MKNIKLNPWYITGQADAEGNFNIKVEKNKSIRFRFHIVQLNTKENYEMLLKVKKYFNDLGKIEVSGKYIRYFIQRNSDIIKVIEHFNLYPLQTKKSYYFNLWKHNYFLKEEKKLTYEHILYVQSLFPTGTNKNLIIKEFLSNFNDLLKLNPYWITGFVNGDGNFTLNVHNNKKSGLTTIPMFRITQHIVDLKQIEKIKEFFNDKGHISVYSNILQYRIWDKSYIINKILPHFEQYSLYGTKYQDYLDFKEGMGIIGKYLNLNKRSSSISKEDLLKIKIIAERMNNKRK